MEAVTEDNEDNIVKAEEIDVEEPEDEEYVELDDQTENSASGINKPKRTVILMQTGSLHLKGFKRPLIVKELRAKLEEFGEVKYFWMNNNKSECLVTFFEKPHSNDCMRGMHNRRYPEEERSTNYAGLLRVKRTDERTVKFAAEKGTIKKSNVSRTFARFHLDLENAKHERTKYGRGEDRHSNSLKRKRTVEYSTNPPRGEGPQELKQEVKIDYFDDEESAKKEKDPVNYQTEKGLQQRSTKRRKRSSKQEMAEQLVCSFFQKTKSKPRIFWKALTDEEIEKKEQEKEREERNRETMNRRRNESRRERSPRRADRDRSRRGGRRNGFGRDRDRSRRGRSPGFRRRRDRRR